MNTTKPPECWASDANARSIRVEIGPGKALLLPFDQFVFAECQSEEKEQQLRLVFATHEVVVRGQSLRRIETAMQRLELSHLACLPGSYRNLVADGQPFIREIAVHEVKDSESTAMTPSS
ncbi:MAG: hypothetical protein KF791_09745 [Verrucomicrobiae bacterium]|nr:hypothetical protein [Verrucomicrobiae bacterium]